MAVIEMNRSATATAGQYGSLFGKAYAAFTAWNSARATRNALNALTDRELADIGISRSQIDYVARRV